MEGFKHQKQPGIIWFTRSGFSLYTPALKSIVKLVFPPEVVDYLEVVDEAKLQQLIQSFISQYKLPELRIYLIIGPDALIEKELLPIPPITENEEEKRILDSMPFENIYSKKYVLDKKIKIACFNANFYQVFLSVFEKTDWQIESVSPYFATGQKDFNETLAASLLKKPEILTQENFINTAIYGTDSEKENKNNQQKKSSLPILLGVFFCLLVVLTIFIIIFTKKSATSLKPNPEKSTSIQPNLLTTPKTQLTTIPATQSADLKSQLKIKLLTPPNQLSQANIIKNSLIQLGYKNIIINETDSINTEQSFLITKSSLSPVYKEQIFTKLKQLLPTIVIQENNDISEEVVVMTPKTL